MNRIIKLSIVLVLVAIILYLISLCKNVEEYTDNTSQVMFFVNIKNGAKFRIQTKAKEFNLIVMKRIKAYPTDTLIIPNPLNIHDVKAGGKFEIRIPNIHSNNEKPYTSLELQDITAKEIYIDTTTNTLLDGHYIVLLKTKSEVRIINEKNSEMSFPKRTRLPDSKVKDILEGKMINELKNVSAQTEFKKDKTFVLPKENEKSRESSLERRRRMRKRRYNMFKRMHDKFHKIQK